MDEIFETSKQVIKDCAKENGAIIASYDSRIETKDYRFVWPRDGAFACVAANKVGIIYIQEKFFKWCIKAEGFKETGLLYKKYNIDGSKDRYSFQPDSTGLILWAVYDFYKDKNVPELIKKLVIKSANALCNIWQEDHFNIITEDLWEERKAFPELKQNFLASIGICSFGLKCAYKLFCGGKNKVLDIDNLNYKKWLMISDKMKETILKEKKFYRKVGNLNDTTVDASLLALVFPAKIVSMKDKRMKNVISKIESEINIEDGIYRYKNDEYDGWMINKKQAKQGAGYWPLLNLWMYKVTNNKKYYNKVLKDTKTFIPEQVFNNNIQVSVEPLLWAHCMYILTK